MGNVLQPNCQNPPFFGRQLFKHVADKFVHKSIPTAGSLIQISWFAFLVPALLLVVFIACGCVGTSFSFANARKVRVGMGYDQVRQIMGKPFMISTASTNEIWAYAYVNGFGASKSVSFVFTGRKVIEVPTIPDSLK